MRARPPAHVHAPDKGGNDRRSRLRREDAHEPAAEHAAQQKREAETHGERVDKRVRQNEPRRAGGERERVEAEHGGVEQAVHAAGDAQVQYGDVMRRAVRRKAVGGHHRRREQLDKDLDAHGHAHVEPHAEAHDLTSAGGQRGTHVLCGSSGDGLADGPARQPRDGADLQADARRGGHVGAVAVEQTRDQRIRQVHHGHLHGRGHAHAQHGDHARAKARPVAQPSARPRRTTSPREHPSARIAPPHDRERTRGRHALRDHRGIGRALHAKPRRPHKRKVKRHVHERRHAHQQKRRARIAVRLEKRHSRVQQKRAHAARAHHLGVRHRRIERRGRHRIRRERRSRERRAHQREQSRRRQRH